MPKNKTHSGASKRFRVTGSGKVLHQRTNRRHNFEHKPSTLTRRLAGTSVVDGADRRRVRRLLGL